MCYTRFTMLKLAINGFGRIGRAAFHAAVNLRGEGDRRRRSERISADEIEVVAVNDLGSPEQLANLLKYDSVYGNANPLISTFHLDIAKKSSGSGHSFSTKQDFLRVGENEIRFLSEKDPAKLPWKELGVDVVLECTGVFADFVKASAHLDAGAPKVVISANAKGEGPTVVLGTKSVDDLRIADYDVFSNASCTTNCTGPVMQVLTDSFGVEKALLTTDHAYTASQNLVDGPSWDPREARAAGENTIPTSTGSARATGKVVHSLEGKSFQNRKCKRACSGSF